MKTKIKDYDGVGYYTDDKGTDIIHTPPNAQWIYKCRVKDRQMIVIGVLTEENVAIPVPNNSYFRDDVVVKKNSLYYPGFHINRDTESSNGLSIELFEEVFPVNVDELQELTISIEGVTYTLGVITERPYSDEVKVCYYDDYIF